MKEESSGILCICFDAHSLVRRHKVHGVTRISLPINVGRVSQNSFRDGIKLSVQHQMTLIA